MSSRLLTLLVGLRRGMCLVSHRHDVTTVTYGGVSSKVDVFELLKLEARYGLYR